MKFQVMQTWLTVGCVPIASANLQVHDHSKKEESPKFEEVVRGVREGGGGDALSSYTYMYISRAFWSPSLRQ